MKIARFIDKDMHHYCVQYFAFKPLYTDVNEFKNVEADKKFSYLAEWCPNTDTIPKLYDRIQMHMEISDHVYVDLGEPGFCYKEDNNDFYTPDFINKFNKTDNVTFFGNLIINVPTNRPCHYLNDMFFQDIEIYKNDPLCIDLLKKLTNNSERKYYWELMCSRHVDLYNEVKKHNVFAKTFTTCHALGISHWGPDVQKPKNMYGGERFRHDNLRCTDLIDPSIYNESFYSCVVETNIPENDVFSMFSEKEAKPIVAKRLFIIVGSKDHLKAFRKLGFKTFSPVIDESYDDEPNKIKRFNMIFDAMDKLTEQDPQEVYKKLQSVLDYNYNHFHNKANWNKELLDAWHQEQMPVS